MPFLLTCKVNEFSTKHAHDLVKVIGCVCSAKVQMVLEQSKQLVIVTHFFFEFWVTGAGDHLTTIFAQCLVQGVLTICDDPFSFFFHLDHSSQRMLSDVVVLRML